MTELISRHYTVKVQTLGLEPRDVMKPFRAKKLPNKEAAEQLIRREHTQQLCLETDVHYRVRAWKVTSIFGWRKRTKIKDYSFTFTL